ncbi:MAG: hypothetical protein NZM44_06565, partial [Candidatus Calescibacterium sp.]|nr:hypothetical protein [Candidatus Calescibacterium sp.]
FIVNLYRLVQTFLGGKTVSMLDVMIFSLAVYFFMRSFVKSYIDELFKTISEKYQIFDSTINKLKEENIEIKKIVKRLRRKVAKVYSLVKRSG